MKKTPYTNFVGLRLNDDQKEIFDEISKIASVSGNCISSDFSSSALLRLTFAMAVSEPNKYMDLLESVIERTDKYDACFPDEKRNEIYLYLCKLKEEKDLMKLI